MRTTFFLIFISILGSLLVLVTTSSQSYVQKASASSGSCPAGQVKDWAGICFNKSEAKACITCTPGSAAASTTEKPVSNTASEKPTESAGQKKCPEELSNLGLCSTDEKAKKISTEKARMIQNSVNDRCVAAGLCKKSVSNTASEKPTESVEKTKEPTTLSLTIPGEIQAGGPIITSTRERYGCLFVGKWYIDV